MKSHNFTGTLKQYPAVKHEPAVAMYLAFLAALWQSFFVSEVAAATGER